MPEMHFRLLWPDGSESLCYSPSLVIEEHLSVGARYRLGDFLARAGAALEVASDRVRQKYGTPCVRAKDQLAQLRRRAADFERDANATVTVMEFRK